MRPLMRFTAVAGILLSSLFAVTGCTSGTPEYGSECVTSFDCLYGYTCVDGYCVEGTTDQGPTDTGVEGVASDDGTALPEQDLEILPDTTETDMPDDDALIPADADEPVEDGVETPDDFIETSDDALALTDDEEVSADDAFDLPEEDVVVDIDVIDPPDEDIPVTDEAIEPVEDDPVMVDDAVIVDEDLVDVTPPEVVTTSPLDEAINVSPAVSVVITFSESLDPMTVDALTVVLVENGSASVDATVTYDDKDLTVTLDPTVDLTYGASYTVTVMTAITDLAGNPLATVYEFSFTVTTCGNGTPEGDEACDDGALNGTYDHCDLFCMGQGSHCGDGVTDIGYELCDSADTIACDQIVGRGYANTALAPCNGTCDGWVTTTCTCATGYEKDGDEVCIDINECIVNENPCDNNGDTAALCANTDGGYTCTCSEGYQFLGGVCRDINECLTLNDPCDDNGDNDAFCSNLAPGYTCVCTSGFEFKNGSCTDIDDCVGNPCDEGGDAAASCTNQIGGYTCTCSAGYTDNGTTCEEIDECAGNPCDDHGDGTATCTDQVNGYTCTCSSVGFTFVDGSCRDVDECILQSNPCDDQSDVGATCANTVGSYACTCSEGFAPGSGTCQDLNECLANNGECDPLTICTNTIGDRTCGACPSGYSGDGYVGCTDINECVVNDNPCNDNGDVGAICANEDGGYACTCSGGYYDNGSSCIEIDDCYNNPCDDHGDAAANCTDIGVGYTCGCSSGFAFTTDSCYDINECTSGNPCDDQGDTASVCTNTSGSYTCACSSGFTAGSGTCQDNDECVAQNNPCNDNGDTPATCTNTPGSYACGCSSGFTFTTGTCLDVNECLTNNGECDPLTICTNTIGGRTCGACPSGYTGDGYVGCTDINECVVNDNPCNDHSDAGATCTNTGGAYTCTCSSGFRFTTGSCYDINECAENLDNCHALASCANTVGSFTCTCIPPATGDGVTCSTCGDGVVNAGESCDDGANNGTYGYCNSTCTGLGERCGDGIKNGPEQCDDGNASNNDNCKNNCTNNVCGDGYVNQSGAFTETFESGAMPSYSSGTWAINTSKKYAGTYAMKSAAIGNNGTSSVTMSHYTDGTICFYFTGSSEDGYDYFRVYVDGAEKFSNSGSYYQGYWGYACISTTAGTRSVEFRYTKDGSTADYDDAYWVDNIRFSGPAEECESGQTTSCTNLGEDCGTAGCSSCRWSTANCYDEDQWGDC